jgi:hypothetical protein
VARPNGSGKWNRRWMETLTQKEPNPKQQSNGASKPKGKIKL